MLDDASQREANEELWQYCRTVEFHVRTVDRDPHLASIVPHAIHEFHIPRIEWLIQRQTFLHRIDVIQLEYTALGQYGRRFRRLVCALFEHDVYFQSIGRSLPFIRSPLERTKALFEYLRAIRGELKLLPKCDHIQVCTVENKRYIESFLPQLGPRIDTGMRAGIDTAIYPFPGGPREPYTMLFLGSFRHACRIRWRSNGSRAFRAAFDCCEDSAGHGFSSRVRTRRRVTRSRTRRMPSTCWALWKTFSRCSRRPRCSCAPSAADRACA